MNRGYPPIKPIEDSSVTAAEQANLPPTRATQHFHPPPLSYEYG